MRLSGFVPGGIAYAAPRWLPGGNAQTIYPVLCPTRR